MKEDLIRNNQDCLPRAGRGATVYILQCANGQYYVGSTTNTARRLDEQGSAMPAINPTDSTQDELGSAQYRGARSATKGDACYRRTQEVYEGTSASEAGLR